MITIYGSWFLVLPLILAVVGVSMWIGYLIGRVRTLDPEGRRLGPAEPSPWPSFLLGCFLLYMGFVLFGPVFAHGIPVPTDALGVFFLVTMLAVFGLGVHYVVRAVRMDLSGRARSRR